MSTAAPPPSEAERKAEYFQLQYERAAARLVGSDSANSRLRHELEQRRNGFALVAQLAADITEASDPLQAVTQAAAQFNPKLNMERTLVLVPAPDGGFSAHALFGYGEVSTLPLPALPSALTEAGGILSSTDEASDELKAAHEAMNLPHFVSAPVIVEGSPVAVIITGRTRQKKLFMATLDQGDLDILLAVAAFLSSILLRARLSDAQRARDHARDVAKAKGDFLANMSHEIRTPMNAIIGMSYLCLKTELNSQQRDYVAKIHNAGTSLLGIINDILDFSKIEAGKLNIEHTQFDLDEVLGNVNSMVGFKIAEQNVEYIIDIADDLPRLLRGDPLRLTQIFTNLLSNAAKFTERGEIRLRGRVIDHIDAKVNVHFSISDTGIGMSPAQVERLFQAFVQADSSTTRRYGGTGLGLTICKRLVELMGGRIWVDSREGEGSTFHYSCWLEVAPDAAPPEDRIPAELHGLRILVVDDNASAREVMVDLMAPLPFHVETAESAADAIAAIRASDTTTPYELVLMDWRMPGMDGVQATRHIVADPTLTNRPTIIVVSAFSADYADEEARAAGAASFLTKPTTLSTMIDTICRTFGAKRESAASDFQSFDLTGLRVLLAEDNEINQQIAREMLTGVGVVVQVVNNGAEAVEALFAAGRDAFDVVMMDLQMPIMDGFQATAKIRGDQHFADQPIVAMTAHAMADERQHCLDVGMNGHVAKPIDPHHLFSTLAQWHKGIPEGSAPRRAAEAHQADAAPEIPEFDVAAALRRVAGNVRTYHSLLRQFAASQRNAADLVEEHVAAGRNEEARGIAHLVKGVAGNLGAVGLAQEAALLEKALEGEGALPVKDQLAGFRKTLTAALAAIASLDAQAQAPMVATVDISGILGEFRDMAADSDALLPCRFDEEREAIAAALPAEQFDRLAEAINGYDMESALVVLEEIAQRRAQEREGP